MPKKQEFSYTFEGKKLGLEVKDRQSAVGIEVVSIVNDSPCLGIVQKGDIIFAVGQHDLRQLHYSDFLKFVKESTRPLTVKFFRPYRQKYDIGSTVLLDSTESDDDEEFHEKVKIISFDDLRGLYKVECEDGKDAAGRGGLDGESLRGEVRDGTKVLAPVAFAGGPGKCMV